MATVGQQLATPESGWKRYDDRVGVFKYSTGWSVSTGTSDYNSAVHWTSTSGCTVTFAFSGTSIRLISEYASGATKDSTITIDGVTETVSQYISGSTNYKFLTYEKTGLTNGIHSVTFTSGTGNTSFDAIDIESTGRIYHVDEVTDLYKLNVGKRIRCNYQVTTSGAFGTFSNLGLETSDFINPTSPTATVNGDFYFIMCEDWNGERKLLADRLIQTSISWDTLNTAGIASGSGKSVNLNIPNTNTIFRLPTGGTSSTDKDNEWDRYVVSSTLNGTITAGDNAVWNWSTTSWTSSYYGANTSRTYRGGASVGSIGSVITSNPNNFRPLLSITETIAPSEVTGLTTFPTETAMTLSWTPPTDPDFWNVNIYRGSTLVGTVNSGTNTFTDTGLTTGNSYTYKVTTMDTSANESTGVTVTDTTRDMTAPMNVTNLSETHTANSVTLSWTPPVDADFSKVKVYRNNTYLNQVIKGANTYLQIASMALSNFKFILSKAVFTES